LSGPYRPRRFYGQATAASLGDGFTVHLDGRAVRTPGKRPLVLPTRPLAAAIADEWQAQGETVDPETMPLMRLAATAIDRTAERPDEVAAEIAGYGVTDLLCYRAPHPAALRARQDAGWQPWLDWLARRHGISLAVTDGIMAVSQPDVAAGRFRSILKALSPMRLTAAAMLTQTTGSLVLALAVTEGELVAEEAFGLSQIDEHFQAEQWGEDAEAAERRARLARDMRDYARFLRLLQD